MIKTIKRIISISLSIIVTSLLLTVITTNAYGNKKIENKVLFEYMSSGAIAVTDDIDSIPDEVYSQENEFSMQVMLKYDHYNDDIFDRYSNLGESFIEYSKRYHTQNNQSFINKIDIDGCDVFVSEYTPYVFIKYNSNSSIDRIYDFAINLVKNDFIDNIRIFPSDIYDLELDELEVVDDNVLDDIGQATTTSTDSRITTYENFPKGTAYRGSGIKIGLLDTGIFNTSHSNFNDITVETVYDTYTGNDSSSSAQHPTWVASVLGGKYGYASAASIYYVDVNSESGYVGIERLINKGCSIVNMSISANSCNNNGEYNTGLEGYLDYIYTSTKVIMVAAAGNSLNKEGTGGYVSLPALCANVISVGSVTSSGVPSDFSSYKIKNDVKSNPNLVAVGSSRYIGGIGYKSGTSFSAPAVSGALALYFGKNGVKKLPAVLSVLSATADSSIVSTASRTISMYELDSSGSYVSSGNTITCTNTKKSNGTYERTGAGMLDISALLNYSNTLINYEITFTSNDYIELKSVYLTAGQTVRVGFSWQRNATRTIKKFLWWETSRTYSSNTLADLDLYLYNSNGSSVAYSLSTNANVELLTYTATADGYYTIKIKPYSNYSDTHNINYAYVIN